MLSTIGQRGPRRGVSKSARRGRRLSHCAQHRRRRFGPQEALELNVRSSKSGLPLVVAAWSRGIMVGQVALVAKKGENGENPLSLSLPDEVGGIIRLTVFDYSVDLSQPDRQFPKPLAERLVYRRLDRRLNVRA